MNFKDSISKIITSKNVKRALRDVLLIVILIFETTRSWFFGMLVIFALIIVLPTCVKFAWKAFKARPFIIIAIPPFVGISRYLANFLINYKYGIEIAYLSGSIHFLSTIIFLYFFVTIVVIISFFYASYVFIRTDKNDKNSYFLLMRSLILLAIVMVITGKSPENIQKLAPLSLVFDSYSYSDCSTLPPNMSTLYLRKNADECYMITKPFPSYPVQWSPVLTIIKSVKSQ